MAAPEADHGYGPPPAYCRDTNTSIYAEVCVPGFTNEARPVELNVKNVVDGEFCYTQTRTECEETTKEVTREICTYTYGQRQEQLDATTIQVGTVQDVLTMSSFDMNNASIQERFRDA